MEIKILILLFTLFSCNSNTTNNAAMDTKNENNKQIQSGPTKKGLAEKHIEQNPVWEEFYPASENRKESYRRIYSDGSFYILSDQRRIQNEKGFPAYVSAPFKWRLSSMIEESAVQEIQELLQSNAFKNIANAQDFEEILKTKDVVIFSTFQYDEVLKFAISNIAIESKYHEFYQKIAAIINASFIPESVPLIQLD